MKEAIIHVHVVSLHRKLLKYYVMLFALAIVMIIFF